MTNKRRWQLGLVGFLGLSVVVALTDPPPPKPVPAVPIAKPVVRELQEGGFFAIIIDRREDSRRLPDIAREVCGARSFCIVTGWVDANLAARGFPFTDREAEAIAFSYRLNREAGNEQILWSCKVWPKVNEERCIASA